MIHLPRSFLAKLVSAKNTSQNVSWLQSYFNTRIKELKMTTAEFNLSLIFSLTRLKSLLKLTSEVSEPVSLNRIVDLDQIWFEVQISHKTRCTFLHCVVNMKVQTMTWTVNRNGGVK